MKNFIFKSETDFHKIVFNKLETLLSEQRHQRVDLASINRLLNVLINDNNLQKQVTDFYETPPQTDTEEQNGTNTGN